jgi:hypothetical protein
MGRAVPARSLVYANNFEHGADGGIATGGLVARWSWSTDRDRQLPGPVPKYGKYLGEFGNETVELSLNGLPSPSRVDLQFKLFILKTWDGNYPDDTNHYGPDCFRVDIEGVARPLLNATFANRSLPAHPDPSDPGKDQTYPLNRDEGDTPGTPPAFPARTGALENDTLLGDPGTLGAFHWSSVYQIDRSFDHSGGTLTIQFTGYGLQAISDESWGLDDVLVVVTPL